MSGVLYGVGLGPGDPQLLTIKALNILQRADILLIPRSAKTSQSTASAIIDSLPVDKSIERRELIYLMDKKNLNSFWKKQAIELAKDIDAGKTLAYVSLGDIGLYSTFGYLQKSLATIGHYKVERVPGISSFQLAAARLGLDLALGEKNFGVYPLPHDIDTLEFLLEFHDTVVLMKIGRHLKKLRDWLRDRNLESAAAFIRRAGFDDEHAIQSLSELHPNESGNLSVVIIHRKNGS